MHPVVARRCQTPLTVYPFDKHYHGDKLFKAPYELKCYRDYRVGTIKSATGEDEVYKSILYIPGEGAEQLSELDEVEVQGGKRTPPLSVRFLPSLHGGLEMVVIYL